jgi:hypothetical protein
MKARASIDGNRVRMAWNPSVDRRGKRDRITSPRAGMAAAPENDDARRGHL